MSDSKKVITFIAALVVLLGVTLGVATFQAFASGVWLQGIPKPPDIACEDLNEALFPEGTVPFDLQPIYGNDATTEWGESWSGAEWANGPICIRSIDDPSCVAQGGCPQPPPQPPAATSSLSGNWIVATPPVTLAGGVSVTTGAVPSSICGGAFPLNLRAVPPTDIFLTYDTVLHTATIQNIGVVSRTFVLEALCP